MFNSINSVVFTTVKKKIEKENIKCGNRIRGQIG